MNLSKLQIFGIFLSILWVIGATYYFKTAADQRKDQIITSANNACIVRINKQKAPLIHSCDNAESIALKKICIRERNEKFVNMDAICPKEAGALRSELASEDHQLVLLANIMLPLGLFWLLVGAIVRILRLLVNRPGN